MGDVIPYRNTYRLDLSALNGLGLTFDTHKLYHIMYCSHTWDMLYVTDDLEDFMETSRTTMEEIENNDLCKGVFINLNVWTLLQHFSNFVNDPCSHYRGQYDILRHSIQISCNGSLLKEDSHYV